MNILTFINDQGRRSDELEYIDPASLTNLCNFLMLSKLGNCAIRDAILFRQ